MSKRVETPRDRTLSADELTALWLAIDKLPELPRAYFRVVLLTGARRNEVRGMAWSELDLNAGLWRLPAERTKSGRPFELPLSAPVLDTLLTLPRIGPMVFAFDGKQPMTLHQLIERVRRDAGLPDVRLHDLRRTLRTGLAELGVSFEVAERVLNHAMPGLQAVYNQPQLYGRETNCAGVVGRTCTCARRETRGDGSSFPPCCCLINLFP